MCITCVQYAYIYIYITARLYILIAEKPCIRSNNKVSIWLYSISLSKYKIDDHLTTDSWAVISAVLLICKNTNKTNKQAVPCILTFSINCVFDNIKKSLTVFCTLELIPYKTARRYLLKFKQYSPRIYIDMCRHYTLQCIHSDFHCLSFMSYYQAFIMRTVNVHYLIKCIPWYC